MMDYFLFFTCLLTPVTAVYGNSTNGIWQINWSHDMELDDRNVTSHIFSCRNVTTTLECLKVCSTQEECKSVFIHKESMVCCLSDVPMHSVTNTTKSPTTRHYVHSWVTQYKASPTTTTTATTTPTTTTPVTTTAATTSTSTTPTTTPTSTTTITTTTTTTPTTTTTTTTITTTTTTPTSSAATTTSTTTGYTACPSNFYYDASIPMCIQIIPHTGLHDDIRNRCVYYGGDLLMLKTVQKRDAVENYITTSTGITGEEYHLGGSYSFVAFEFQWVDGTSVISPPWSPGEPDQKGCVVYTHGTGQWRDEDCSIKFKGICEIT